MPRSTNAETHAGAMRCDVLMDTSASRSADRGGVGGDVAGAAEVGSREKAVQR